MPKRSDYEEKYYSSNYTFDLGIRVSLEFATMFLKSRDYEIKSVTDCDEDDRYLERTITTKICAVKVNEEPDLRKNEITDVFRKEYEKILLSLLINSRDINYYEQLIKEQSK